MINNYYRYLFAVLICLTANLLAESTNYYYPSIDYSKIHPIGVQEQEARTEKIEAFLQKEAAGLGVSYRTVINAIIEEGHDVYLRGGVLRDLLSNSPSEPNDIDFDYTGSLEDLLHILDKHQWTYTHLPERQIVIIGDHRSCSMDALPVYIAIDSGEDSLEFTVNNIFYHCNTKTFLRGSEIGLRDLEYGRINILNEDWHKWLYNGNAHEYYKIFRFWKMVGKGYVYTTEMGEFFYEETAQILKKDKMGFRQELLHYISGHYPTFDEVYRGAMAVMGYEWANANFLSLKQKAESTYHEMEKVKDRYTFHKRVPAKTPS